MDFTTDEKNLIITIPLWQDACDYFGEKVGSIPNIIGVCSLDKGGEEELGFHKTIDMTYKGKEPQIDGLMVSYFGEKEDFIKLCEKLDIDYFEYPVCSKCGQTIWGSFTGNKDYDKLCYECEQKLKE